MNFTPVKQKLTIYKGSRYEHTVEVLDTDNVTPVPLTGFTARMQFRNKVTDTTVLFEATTENALLVVNGAEGTVTVIIPGDTSSAWDFKKGVYDLEIESPSGYSYRIMEGGVAVRPEVTR